MCQKTSSDPTSRSQVLIEYSELFDEYLRMSVSFLGVTSYGAWEQEIDDSREIGFQEVCTSILEWFES